MSGELLAAALRYAAKGWRVLQVKPGGNAPMMGIGWQPLDNALKTAHPNP